MLLELLDYTFEIWIAGAKASCEPVPSAFDDSLAISDYLKLTQLTGRDDRFNSQALFD